MLTLRKQHRLYEKYRDSGVEWLGEIPEEWETLRAGCVYKEINERSNENDEDNLLSVSEYYGVKKRAEVIEEDDWITNAASVEGYKKCLPGDLVMNIMLAWKCGLGVSNFEGIVSPAYCVFRSKGTNHPKYLHYLLRTKLYTDQFKNNSKGIIDSRLRLYPDKFKPIPILLPPPQEQSSIASYLDKKCALIDSIIAKKQWQIELLKEKRAAIINRAVTRGLDEDVEMKESGVEWIGEVPKGWEIIKLGKLSTKMTNGFVGPTRDIFVDEGVKYLQSLHIKNNRITFSTEYYVSEKWSNEHSKSILKENDLLFVQTGDIGQVGLVTKEYEGSNCHALIITRPILKYLIPEYLVWFFLSDLGQNLLKLHQTGAMHPHLNCRIIKYIPVAIPTKQEQESIVQNLNEAESKHRTLEDNLLQSISLLSEYKISLIAHAVTGRIKVPTKNDV